MKEPRKRDPHYVDVMETWSTALTALYFYLILFFGFADFVLGNIESPIICILAMAFMLGIVWLPGMLMLTFREGLYERIATVKLVYQNPRSIVICRLRHLNHLRIGGPANIAAIVSIGVVCGLAIIMSIVGVVLDDEISIAIVIGCGALLSWVGALIIGLRMAYDFVSEKRKMRWVF